MQSQDPSQILCPSRSKEQNLKRNGVIQQIKESIQAFYLNYFIQTIQFYERNRYVSAIIIYYCQVYALFFPSKIKQSLINSQENLTYYLLEGLWCCDIIYLTYHQNC
ncbi:hypothetical protein ABPG72_021038 [Tetrahymena utriculariae]